MIRFLGLLWQLCTVSATQSNNKASLTGLLNLVYSCFASLEWYKVAGIHWWVWLYVLSSLLLVLVVAKWL